MKVLICIDLTEKSTCNWENWWATAVDDDDGVWEIKGVRYLNDSWPLRLEEFVMYVSSLSNNVHSHSLPSPINIHCNKQCPVRFIKRLRQKFNTTQKPNKYYSNIKWLILFYAL
jgi:hypothetical protein